MEEIMRNVTEIEPADRQALEHVLGPPLHDHQMVVVRVVSTEAPEHSQANGDQDALDDALPDWCDVYEGLSDDEIASIEEIMLTRADLTRRIE
jgi:hypothetical protein